MTAKYLTSRSAILARQRCPQQFYLNYHYNGRGIVPTQVSLKLDVGICVHKGLETLLRAHIGADSILPNINNVLDTAVLAALTIWKETVIKRPLTPQGIESVEFVVHEVAALIEGLIRVYALGRLSDFLREFEILEIEEEDVTEMADFIFMGKADGLLRRRYDNKLVVLSFKTSAGYYTQTESNINIDMQGLSECYSIRRRFENYLGVDTYMPVTNWPNYFVKLYEAGLFSDGVKINNVQYEYLIKGAYRSARGKNSYSYQTSLVHPYRNEGVIDESWIEFDSEESQSIEGGYAWHAFNPGRQPAGWSTCNIWEHLSMKQWVEMLASKTIQPEFGDPFADILKAPENVSRSDDEINRWASTTKHNEALWSYNVGLAKYFPLNSDFIQDVFEKYTHSCNNHFGGQCPYFQICHHEGITINDLIEWGSMAYRESHHELELSTINETLQCSADNEDKGGN